MIDLKNISQPYRGSDHPESPHLSKIDILRLYRHNCTIVQASWLKATTKMAELTAGFEAFAKQQVIEVRYQVIHVTTGRLRVRIHRLAIDPEYTSKLQRFLKSSVQVLNVRFNPVLSCLIVHYEADFGTPA